MRGRRQLRGRAWTRAPFFLTPSPTPEGTVAGEGLGLAFLLIPSQT